MFEYYYGYIKNLVNLTASFLLKTSIKDFECKMKCFNLLQCKFSPLSMMNQMTLFTISENVLIKFLYVSDFHILCYIPIFSTFRKSIVLSHIDSLCHHVRHVLRIRKYHHSTYFSSEYHFDQYISSSRRRFTSGQEALSQGT